MKTLIAASLIGLASLAHAELELVPIPVLCSPDGTELQHELEAKGFKNPAFENQIELMNGTQLDLLSVVNDKGVKIKFIALPSGAACAFFVEIPNI